MMVRRASTIHSPEPPDRDALLVTGVCITLVSLVWIALGQAIHHEFVNYDDDRYVYDNPTVAPGLTLHGFESAFTRFQVSNWHPLTIISHMLDCQIYGLAPWGHHLTNIILHTAAAMLLFVALRKLTLLSWPSAFVAALFAIHPLRVESVAWVAERKDVLSGVFFMLTILAYARYTRGKHRSLACYATVLLFFALGLLCKPTLVTLPFVLLLLDYWPLGRMQRAKGKEPGAISACQLFSFSAFQKWPEVGRLIVEKVPLLALSIASCVVTIFAQREAFAAIQGLPLRERIANAAVSYMTYLGQTIYPVHLAVLYPYSEQHIPMVRAIAAFLCLLVISVTCVAWRTRAPYLFTGWFWFIGMLVPMIGLVQVGSQSHADRYTYLPQIGLFIIATWGTIALVSQSPRRREILATLAVLVISALTAYSYFETSYWQTGETLWKHTIKNTSGNYIAHNNYANWLLPRGRLDEALAESTRALGINANLEEVHVTLGNILIRKNNSDAAVREFELVLQHNPDFADVRNNLANVMLQKGQVSDAIANYETALRTNPNQARTHSNLGNALLRTGKIDDAIAHYQEALKIDPKLADIHRNLGNALQYAGRLNDAIIQYQEALVLRTDFPEAEYNLANALLQEKNNAGAIEHYRKALELKPDYADAAYNMSKAFAAPGNYSEAIAAAETAVQIRPDYQQAHNNLACFEENVGNVNEAIREFDRALQIDPDFVDAHYNLGRLLIELGRKEDAIEHLRKVLRLNPNYADAKQVLLDVESPGKK